MRPSSRASSATRSSCRPRPGRTLPGAAHLQRHAACRGAGRHRADDAGLHAIVHPRDGREPDLPDRQARRSAGRADRRALGLTTSIVTEPDADGDLRGDLTEDRPDLRVSARRRASADGRLRVDGHRDQRRAARPRTSRARRSRAARRALGGRLLDGLGAIPTCVTPRLAAGRVARVRPARRRARRGHGVGHRDSEGTDLAPADNTATAAFAAAAPSTSSPPTKQRLSQGVKVQVRAVRAGRTRVTRRVQGAREDAEGGQDRHARALHGPHRDDPRHRARSCARCGGRLARAELSAEITARTFSGKTPVTAKVTVTR